MRSGLHEKRTAFQYVNIIPTVKCGGGRVMIWGCFTASGPGQLEIVRGKINSKFIKVSYKITSQ